MNARVVRAKTYFFTLQQGLFIDLKIDGLTAPLSRRLVPAATRWRCLGWGREREQIALLRRRGRPDSGRARGTRTRVVRTVVQWYFTSCFALCAHTDTEQGIGDEARGAEAGGGRPCPQPVPLPTRRRTTRAHLGPRRKATDDSATGGTWLH
eukprot:scaffold19235_cov126-Isochrysis_galbana.AAC.23